MPIETMYACASGTSYGDCAYIGYRFDSDRGFRAGEIESWVVRNEFADDGEPGTTYQFGSARWYTGLWRSPSHMVYVCDSLGDVAINPRLEAPDSHVKWGEHSLDASLFGIFGTDDQHVWTWGQRRNVPVMFFWNGGAWSEVPSPDFDVVRVHGTGPHLLFAVGRSGGIAQWDGSSWRRWACPVPESLTAVWVESEDEIYATADRGSLLEGSKHGWAKIAQGPGPGTALLGVTKWKGQLWVGAGPFGLLRRVDATERLEVIKENIRATGFDAREGLVITTDDIVAGTSDASAFFGCGDEVLLNGRDGHALLDVD